MASRAPRKFLIKRSKDNLSVVFGRRARRIGSHALGNLQAVASTRAGRIDIKNIEETERREIDFFEIKNIRFNHWWTRNWSAARTVIARDVRVGAHTNRADVITELNNITGYTTATEVGDEGGSGLSSVGGTSIVSFRMENVNYGLEDGTGFLLYEDDDNLVSEELNTVLQRSDGTFLSVDTRSVSHGGGGGSAGNPVVSGAVSTDTLTLTLDDASTVDVDVSALRNNITSGAVSGTNLVLTREDASTVTIDATLMVNGTLATIDLPNWYQTYATPGDGSGLPGAQINDLAPGYTGSPFYFGQTLARGYEFVWNLSYDEDTNYIGIWGGSTSYTNTQAGRAVYWTKHLRYSSGNDEIRHGNNQYDSVGWDLTADYSTTHGTTKLALVYDYSTNKLQLWETTGDYRTIICTASVAEDGNPVTISSALASGSALPNFGDSREQTWNLIGQLNAGGDTTWRDGLLAGSVWKHNVGLHPGEKMVLTTPSAWINQYHGWDYSGASLGQSNPYNENTGKVQFASSEKIVEKDGFTINTLATRFEGSDDTEAMGGGKISWRYHLNNTVDLYDEDNEDVIMTKDVAKDGNPIFLHLYMSTNVNLSNLLHLWSFEPFAATWFYHGESKYKPNQRYTPTALDGSSRHRWGELMYPGQELVWNHTNTNNNVFVGRRNAADTAWTRNFTITQTQISATVNGFTALSAYTVASKTLSLRYDHGDNKLKLYDVTTSGVHTLFTAAVDAEDGNAIEIHISGNGTALPASALRYYHWEYIHTPTAYPQVWKNWRINRPSTNDGIKIDTALRHRRALIPGYYMRWRGSSTAPNFFMGQWKSANGTSGLSNIEATAQFWDWGFKGTNQERVLNLLGFTFNTSNPNYNASPYWQDPDPGTTEIQWRYNSNNSIDLYDHTNSAIIATKDDDGDGSGIYLTFATGSGLTTVQLADDFLGGGDVTFGTL